VARLEVTPDGGGMVQMFTTTLALRRQPP